MQKLTVFILTGNEEIHIARAIQSARQVTDRIFVIDSLSTDRTVEIARNLGATVLVNPWTNHAMQVNWTIENIPCDCDWLLRLDADEVINSELAQELREELPIIPDEVSGIYVHRRIRFLGHMLRHGGVRSVTVMRLFRRSRGRCEERWMDEHIHVDGPTRVFAGAVIDENLNPLSWWVRKHDGYASLEAVDLLNLEHGFMPRDSIASLLDGGWPGLKRWVKERVYALLPGGARAGLYFLYRYVLRLGFLDGPAGRRFHVLQGFWYRYLVDAKLFEVRQYMQRHEVEAPTAIRDVLQIDLRSLGRETDQAK